MSGDDVFFAATGATSGDLFQGVRFEVSGARTKSLVMRFRSGTIPRIDSTHSFSRLDKVRF